jgi:hypothetical protein
MTQADRDGKEPMETSTEGDSEGTPRRQELPKAGDLVLRDEKGDYFWIPKAEYAASKIRRAAGVKKMTSQMRHLTQQGVLLADVPRGELKGVGFACVLINLAAIRRPSATSPKTKSPVSPRPRKKP